MNSIDAVYSSRGPSQKPRKLWLVVYVVGAVAFLFITHPLWGDGQILNKAIGWIGISLIVICIIGRTWSSLFIGGHKNNRLIIDGPYSVTRNPLYFFSILGAMGGTAQFGSVIITLASGLCAWAVFLWTVIRKEAALRMRFGDEYETYLKRVPRFWPTFALWYSRSQLIVKPELISKTFFDALFFLAAIPAAEFLEWLHHTGALPIWLYLP